MVGKTGAYCSIFSFQTVRLPNTLEGGILLFKDKSLNEKAKKIRDYGIERSQFRDKNNEISSSCDITIEGYGALMSELNSYIGYRQMEDLPDLLVKQRSNGQFWKEYLESNYPDIKPIGFRSRINPNFWVFSFITDEKIKMLENFRAKGFYASGIHINNDLYSVFGKQSELKGVNEFVRKHLALPSGWWVNNNHLNA